MRYCRKIASSIARSRQIQYFCVQTSNIDMSTEAQHIVISDYYPQQVLSEFPGRYLNHILCLEGRVTFRIGGHDFELLPGDMAIFIPQTMPASLMFSADYRGNHLLLSGHISHSNNPSRQWGDKGFLFASSNPIFHFTEAQIGVFQRNLDIFRQRIADTGHLFYAEVLGSCVRTFLYDMWNIYAPELEKRAVSQDGGPIFERFMALLSIHCRKEREVSFYADKLFITPKYLSEICRKKSGRGAMSWIKDYAMNEIVGMLKDPNLTITDISDRMHFQNVSFFCRYAKNLLGKTPTEYREML